MNFMSTFFRKYSDLINLHDIQMLSLASKYNLSIKTERDRSVKDLEKLFFRLVGYISPDLFIEAGAKDARTSLRARRYLNESRIFAFEANPRTYDLFNKKQIFQKNNIDYIHAALSDNKGELLFNIPISEGEANTSGRGSILMSNDDTIPAKVNSIRLDSYFSEHFFKKCAIWIDVEGANKQVLTGAKGLLSKLEVVFIEVEDRSYWKDQWLSYDVMNFFLKEDFLPVGRDFQSRYQYNIIFIKRKFIKDDRIRYFLSMYMSELKFFS